MLQPYTHSQFSDEQGRPEGGVASGVGFVVSWQRGPLGRGEDRAEPNGAFVETLLQVVEDRLRFYQGSFPCEENAVAIDHVSQAIAVLQSRTARRETAGVEGTHEGN